MRGQRATGKIQRNNYHHESCGPSLTGKTMSVFLIFTQGTHRNAKIVEGEVAFRMELYHFNRYQLVLVSTYLCTHHRREEFITELANYVVS